MADAIVTAEGIGKRYKIGHMEPYGALRDVITGVVKAPLRLASRVARPAAAPAKQDDRFIWALEDVSFTMRQGEVLGLIGANGAGKSTLLKILSRITEPTTGRAELRGRVGSLLEVGTGFHPELTGRENVYLNGSILGMRRTEIQKQFDAIVEFSGVEKFLDTPVKRYSSGMQVRLAFAVAAHLQPEILLVDEVLAVGDAQFQAKCLGKMEDVTREGRTIVFVSHNLAAVRNLCPRSLVLEKGRLVFDGPTDDAIERYLSTGAQRTEAVVSGEQLERSVGKVRLYGDEEYFRCDRIAMVDEAGTPRTSFRSDEPIVVEIDWECLRPLSSFRMFVMVSDRDETPLLRTDSIDDPSSTAMLPIQPGRYRSTAVIPPNLFGEERLMLNVALVSEVLQTLDYSKVIEFTVGFQGYNGNTRSRAFFRPRVPWETAALVEQPV